MVISMASETVDHQKAVSQRTVSVILGAWILLNTALMGVSGEQVVDGFLATTGLPESVSFTVYVYLTAQPLLVSGLIAWAWRNIDGE